MQFLTTSQLPLYETLPLRSGVLKLFVTLLILPNKVTIVFLFDEIDQLFQSESRPYK